MKKRSRMYVAEFLGTFTLVFVGTAVATLQGFLPGYGNTGWLGVSFAFGLVLMALVWVIGPISGCHINPAVTIPMALSGRLKASYVPGYLISQILGALGASALLWVLLSGVPGYELVSHGLGANGNPRGMSVPALLGWEAVMTALFVFTIFSATKTSSTAGRGLAIGGFFFVAYLAGAPLGGASLNPARSLGPAVLEGGAALSVLWVFLVAPVVGGMVGWILHRVVHGGD
jgi:aquaporin Z